MKVFRPFSLWSLALRGLLVLALLAIAPLYERAHAMTSAPVLHMAMADMPDHGMAMGPMSQHQTAAHGNHDAACRILCFGWVEASAPPRRQALLTATVADLRPAPAPLRTGLDPAPSGHPPKAVRFV